MLLADVAPSPFRKASPLGLGLCTCFQVRPFQCRISVCVLPPLTRVPAAQALPAEVAATAFSRFRAPGEGLAALAHRRPFQRRISVLMTPLLVNRPTAHALVP